MVLLEFSLYPTDKGASVSEYVKRNLEIIDDSGLPYVLELDEVARRGPRQVAMEPGERPGPPDRRAPEQLAPANGTRST